MCFTRRAGRGIIFVVNTYRLIRWMDKPVLWRYAVRVAEQMPHEHDGHCPPCAAKKRRERNVHQPTINFKRQIECRKCGLTETKWAKKPHCPNKFPVTIIQRIRRAAHLPVGW